MKTILFQGDSITDVGRNRERNDMLGWGYPRLIEAQLGFDCPGEYNFQNRGIGGNRILDLYARIVQDILNIAPDYLSILIGVNDIWHGLDNANGTGLNRFEKVYDMLLTELQEELPETKIMIMEPFVLRGSATDNREDQPDRWETFRGGVYQVAAIVKNLAEKHKVKFIPLQEAFNEAEKLAPVAYWCFDGVHPSAKGHELIKRQWLKAFEEIK